MIHCEIVGADFFACGHSRLLIALKQAKNHCCTLCFFANVNFFSALSLWGVMMKTERLRTFFLRMLLKNQHLVLKLSLCRFPSLSGRSRWVADALLAVLSCKSLHLMQFMRKRFPGELRRGLKCTDLCSSFSKNSPTIDYKTYFLICQDFFHFSLLSLT